MYYCVWVRGLHLKTAVSLKGLKSSVITRQHSSRMRTARLPTVWISVATTRCQWGEGGRTSSEQVWTGLQWWPPDVTSRRMALSEQVWTGLMSREVPQAWCPGGYPRPDVQRGQGDPYHMVYPIMHMMLPTPTPRTDRHLWKHYLPTTIIVGGNKKMLDV